MDTLKRNQQLAALAAIVVAAFSGGAITDYAPDPASLAKFGPIAFAVAVYFEFRVRPLLVTISHQLGAKVDAATSEQLAELTTEITDKVAKVTPLRVPRAKTSTPSP